MRLAALFAALMVVAPTLHAEGEADPKNHKGQGLVNLQLGTGYRAIFTYDEEFCGDVADDGGNATNCSERKPTMLGILVGYGVLDSLELVLELGVGIESEFGDRNAMGDGPRPFMIAPGVKAYLTELGPTQLFSTLQFVVDFTDFSQVEGLDYAVRNINGLQFDVHRTVGLYVYFGESVGFKRWLSFAVEGGVGIQARFP